LHDLLLIFVPVHYLEASVTNAEILYFKLHFWLACTWWSGIKLTVRCH